MSLPAIGFAVGIALIVFALSKGMADKLKAKGRGPEQKGEREHHQAVVAEVEAQAKASLPDGVKIYRRKVLLTDPEQVLFHRLREALPDHIVLSQVALNQVVGVDRSVKEQAVRTRAQYRINPKSVDFVVCKLDGCAVAVIELDDATHEREDRKQSDREKERALRDAGIPVHRFSTNALPGPEQIQATLRDQAA